MILPNKSVLTGLKALYLHGLVSFDPEFSEIIINRGQNLDYFKTQNVTHPRNIYRTQIKEVKDKFTQVISGINVYTIERLFVELDTFQIDAQLRTEALNKMRKRCDPYKVDKVIRELKKRLKGKFTPSRDSVDFIRTHTLHIHSAVDLNFDYGQYMREYIQNKLYESNIPHFIKGGSVIEVYTSKKRGTNDIDGYFNIGSHKSIIEAIEKDKDGIKLSVRDFNGRNFNNIFGKKRSRMVISCKAMGRNLHRRISNIEITIDVDYSLSEKDIQEIIVMYSLKAHKLWKSERKYFPISREMVVAEKIMSALDSQDKKKWRAKDMMDIHNILKQRDIKKDKIKSWFLYKLEKYNKTIDEYRDYFTTFKNNKNDLVKILDATLSTYSTDDFDWDKVVNEIDECLK